MAHRATFFSETPVNHLLIDPHTGVSHVNDKPRRRTPDKVVFQSYAPPRKSRKKKEYNQQAEEDKVRRRLRDTFSKWQDQEPEEDEPEEDEEGD